MEAGSVDCYHPSLHRVVVLTPSHFGIKPMNKAPARELNIRVTVYPGDGESSAAGIEVVWNGG